MSNRIKELRNEKELSLTQMAEKIGIGRGTINNYENGKTNPTLKTWKKLADFFNVPVEYIQGKGMNVNEIKFVSCYIMALSALGAFNKDAQESYVFKELDDKVNYFLWLKNLTYSDIKRLNNHEKTNVFEKFNKKINYDYYFKNNKQEELILKVTDYFMKSLAQITDDNFFYKLGSLLASTYDNQDFIDPVVVGKYLCILLKDCNIALENDVFNQTNFYSQKLQLGIDIQKEIDILDKQYRTLEVALKSKDKKTDIDLIQKIIDSLERLKSKIERGKDWNISSKSFDDMVEKEEHERNNHATDDELPF